MAVDYNAQINAIINKMLAERTEEIGSAGTGRSGGKGKVSFFEALAIAMGEVQGKYLGKMMQSFSDLQKANHGINLGGGKVDQEAANRFSIEMSRFQAYSQLFNMTANTSSNALKSLGEGMTAVGRKN